MSLAFMLLIIMLASVASSTIDGRITRVNWSLSSELVPITVKPLITIENTGDQRARYHIVVAVEKNGNRYAGACWITDEVGIEKTGMTGPYPQRLSNRGDLAYLQVELYSDSYLKNQLLDVKRKRERAPS